MGTLATVMAGKKIPTPEGVYWADVEGDIENVGGVLKITTIRVKYHLKAAEDTVADAKESFANYITRCPAAQTVKDCIKLQDELILE
ncbi:MAG TPA: OsmC family protein [Syntrophales bacterium]|nr:OsmC family protein [Syntrophales bacterium]